MMEAADQLEFERAAAIRDRITQMQDSIGKKVSEVKVASYDKSRSGGRRRQRRGAKVPRPKKK